MRRVLASVILRILGVRTLISGLSMIPAGAFASSVGVLTVPWWTAREMAALIVVVVSLAFFRAFRHRYLLLWGAAWLTYGAFLWATGASQQHAPSKAIAAFTQADFVLAIGLFATAALLSVRARRTLAVVLAVSWVAMVCAAMRPLYFPDSKPFELGLDLACRARSQPEPPSNCCDADWGVSGWVLSCLAPVC